MPGALLVHPGTLTVGDEEVGDFAIFVVWMADHCRSE
jgi:hypothetical protein